MQINNTFIPPTNSVNIASEISQKLGGFEAPNKAEIQSMASKIDMRLLSDTYAISSFTSANFAAQGGVSEIFGAGGLETESSKAAALLTSFDASSIGYAGKPLYTLNKDEAAMLVREGGFFDVENTAKRISDFVIGFSGNDEAMLKAGREGMLRGFAQAEKIWGGKLPDISQQSISLATQKVDEALAKAGGNVVDESV